jgi:hypothetical protein
MRIILTKEENEARLRNPKGAVTVSIHGGDGIARVAAYADISSKDALEKVESESTVEVEAAKIDPSVLPRYGPREIRLFELGIPDDSGV